MIPSQLRPPNEILRIDTGNWYRITKNGTTVRTFRRKNNTILKGFHWLKNTFELNKKKKSVITIVNIPLEFPWKHSCYSGRVKNTHKW